MESIIKEIRKVTNMPNASSLLIKTILKKELLKKSNVLKSYKQIKNDPEMRRLILEVAQKLRMLYNPLQKKYIKKALDIIFENGEKNDTSKIKELLMLDTKIKHRINFYREISKEIKILNPKEILELDCGFDPIGLKFVGDLHATFYLVDPQPDVLYINECLIPEVKIFDGDCIEFSIDKDYIDCLLVINCQGFLESFYNIFINSIKSNINFEYVIFAFKKKKYKYLLKKLNKDFKLFKSFETKNEVFLVYTPCN